MSTDQKPPISVELIIDVSDGHATDASMARVTKAIRELKHALAVMELIQGQRQLLFGTCTSTEAIQKCQTLRPEPLKPGDVDWVTKQIVPQPEPVREVFITGSRRSEEEFE